MFKGLHQRLEYLYACDCQNCKEKFQRLDKKKANTNLLDLADKAFKKVFKSGYDVKNLFKDKTFKGLLNGIKNTFNEALSEGVADNQVPPEMLKALKQDIFVFSALKTHAQLSEASQALTDENGNVRTFQQYEQEYKKINENYNVNHLEPEYEFAVGTAQSAAQWADIEKNAGRYDLQFRTAGDEKVRKSHAQLNGTTLPPDDDFWNWGMPPLAWRCRCRTVEVLKGKFTLSESTKANELLDKATTEIGKNGVNRLEIFRFNAGKEKVIFPPKHPYYKVAGANDVINQIN